jgi:hypothetical protein
LASLHPKAKSPQSKKDLTSSFRDSFILSSEQGETVVLGEECDTVTGETFVPASLNVNNLGKAALLPLPPPWPGLCLSQPTDLRESS